MENRIANFFKSIFSRTSKKTLMDSNEKFSRELGRKVDDILEFELDDIDLARKFDVLYRNNLLANGISNEDLRIKKYYTNGMYPLQTKISKEQALELAGEFFESIFPDQKEHFQAILRGEGKNSDSQKIFLNLDETGKINASATSPTYPTDDITVNVPLYGDLRDVYTLVHEISHTIDAKSGANETRAIYGEIIPQAMERALDDFLDCMPKDERDKYGFDLKTLEQDIKDRRLSTFVNRLNIIREIPNKRGADKMFSSRYLLAQVYQSKLIKLFNTPKKFGDRIMKIAQAIQNNDSESLKSITGVDLTKKSDKREKFLDETSKQFVSEINGRTALRTNEEVVLDLEQKYKKMLAQRPKEDVREAFKIWRSRRALVNRGINPEPEEMSPGVQEIFDLLEEFRGEIKESFLENGLTLSHITSVSPTEMEGRKIRKSIQIPNNYETKIVDGVFASSENVNGLNPYIARTNMGMIFIGGNAYVFGSDNFNVQKDENGKSHVYLKNLNYAYFFNPAGFEPEVGLSIDRDGKPYFNFSHEWISPNDMDLENPNQVVGYRKIHEVTDLLENYQVLVDVHKKRIGMQLRDRIFNKKEDMNDIKEFILKLIESGDVRYINGEANISAISFEGNTKSKMSQIPTKDE